MDKIRVTKEFEFEMAHALWNYDGPCKNIHGHSYKLSITVIGTANDDETDPKYGMIVDFGDLKDIVKSRVVDRFDHSVLINEKAPHQLLKNAEQMFEKFEVVDYQPTCENIIIDIVQGLRNNLPDRLDLFSVKLAETSNSYAEWYATDNE